MLSLIKSKAKKDGIRTVVGAGNRRSKSLITRHSEAIVEKISPGSSAVNEVSVVTSQDQQQNNQLVVNSSGETVLLHSSGGPSFGFTAMEIQRPSSVMLQHSNERPSSRSSNSSSRRSNQPRLGVGNNNTYLFEDDPGIMSEVETASTTRLRKPHRGENHRPPPAASSGAATRLPRTSPKSYTNSALYDEDPGIMSEAETASTTRGKRSSSRNNSIPSMGYKSQHGSQRSVQFRYPVAQFHTPSASMFDDDPGIMSEADTSSTSGRKRREIKADNRKQPKFDPKKDALPIVRTPSKTLERPLGLVFLVYRGETKRAVLPNEITSLDTVKALFVRSFTKTLTMDYMYTPRVCIYIHDSSKDIFYELENLSEIRDRTILKLFEADNSGRGPSGLGPGGLPPITNADEEAAAVVLQQQHTVPPISEPEYVDSRHVKAMKVLNRVQREYEQAVSNTLPRNAFSALEQEKLASLLQQQPTTNGSTNRSNTLERSKTLGPGFMRGHHHGYMPDPGASQDNEVMIPSRFSSAMLPEGSGGRYYSRPESTEEAKARMMHMEAQLSQLTGMVEKALKNKKMGKKTVSFDKSVTYSDDPHPHPQGILVTNKIKSNGQLKVSIGNSDSNNHVMVPKNSTSHGSDPNANLDVNLKRLHRSARELKQEVRVLRRLTQLQSMAMKDLVQDTYIKLREACISFSTTNSVVVTPVDPELYKLVHNEEDFVQELNELVTSICQLEGKVEETRSGVINKKNKISLEAVENMAFTLSKCSKTVTLLKQAFPTLEANIKSKVGSGEQSSEKRRMTEDFLKRTPERMENIWRRCKKLTGTLVTLKRLASVQEQRFHPGASIEMSLSPTPSELVVQPKVSSNNNNHHSNNQPQPQQQQQNGVIEASPHKRKTSRPSSAEVKEVIQDVNGSSSNANGTKKGAPPPPPPRSSSTKNNEEETKKEPPPVAAKPKNVDISSLTAKARQDALEQRHQELLNRQKQLTEQYERLQNMQKQTDLSNSNSNGAGSSTSSLSSTSSSVSTTAEAKPKPENTTDTATTTAADHTDASIPSQPLQPKPSKNKPPPPVPLRTNSSLTANVDSSNQKVYQSDMI